MRKIKYFLAAIGAIVMTNCTNEEYIGQKQGTTPAKGNEAIVFSGGASSLTRANLYGSDAAGKLTNKFVVYGTKHLSAAENETATNDAIVFNNFQVEWAASSAGSTESNSSDWEYVNKQAYNATPTSQGIKYWDYNAVNGHTFYAFSSTDISYPKGESDKVQVTKVAADGTTLYNKGYNVTIKSGASLNNLYFSDRVEVPKTKYGNTVTLTFRNMATRVRVGFYETIPGYSVKIDKFYIDGDAEAAVTTFPAMNVAKTDGFYASLQNVKRDIDQNVNVTYYSSGTEINRPKMSNPTGNYNWSLKLGDGTGIINQTLGTTSSSPTWVAGKAADNYYISVFPFEGNNNPLLLKLDFTMTADDGSGDEIKVRGARAVVPAEYMKWKSNFAYTYIFKISDKTNGTTGAVDANDDPTTDPEGLKPITFDAIVVNMTDEIQETITSVSTNSITTYAGGAIVNEYTNTKPIYVVVSNASSGAVITPTGLGDTDGKAQVYKLNKAASEAEVLAQLTGSSMGITMTAESTTLETTIPLADGTTPSISNVKFTPSAASTCYAYVYTTKKYVAPTYLSQENSSTYDSSKTYYMKTANNVYYAVSVPSSDAFAEHKAQLYIIDPEHAGTAGVYDVKIIKVQ